MSYILTKSSLINSARVLANALNMRVYTVPQSTSPAIRWGTSDGEYVADTAYNRPELIRISSSKRLFAERLATNGVPVISFQTGTPDHFPVVVRTITGGHGGAGIIVVESAEEFSNYSRHAWSYWRNYQWEIGVHALGGEVVRVFTKVWRLQTEVPRYPIRNTDLGWEYSLRSIDIYERHGLREFVRRVWQACPLEMMRLDIGRVKGGLEVIEANSAPNLSANANTAELYINFLRSRLE